MKVKNVILLVLLCFNILETIGSIYVKGDWTYITFTSVFFLSIYFVLNYFDYWAEVQENKNEK